MKVIDSAQRAAPTSEVEKVISQAKDAVGKILGGTAEAQGQETLIHYLGRVLNNRFVLLRNVKLEGADITIPIILIGPSGISVITTRAGKGVYQIKAEAIARMTASKEFTPIRPSPVNRTILMAEAVTRYLRDHNVEPPEVQPVMFFSNPGTHIDSVRPAVRLVLMDGLERFVTTLQHGQAELTPDDVHKLVEILHRVPTAITSEAGQHPQGKSAASVLEPRLSKGIDRVGQKFSLSPKQWILLGVMAVFEVLILIGFIFLIVSTSRGLIL